MSNEITLDVAAKVVADRLAKGHTSYAAGMAQPLSTHMLAKVGNVMVFEVLDIVAQRRVKFKVVVEEIAP